jgi:hypothetical protein
MFIHTFMSLKSIVTTATPEAFTSTLKLSACTHTHAHTPHMHTHHTNEHHVF